jgi:hypothetical protein
MFETNQHRQHTTINTPPSTHHQQTTNPPLVSWYVGGVLVCWCVGVLVCWCVGMLVCWCVGVLVCWYVGGDVGGLLVVSHGMLVVC